MSGQKRPADPSTSSSSGTPPEKRREREGEDGGPSVSSAAGGSTAVETVIKLGGVSNSVRPSLILHNTAMSFLFQSWRYTFYDTFILLDTQLFFRRSKTLKLYRLRIGSWVNLLIRDRSVVSINYTFFFIFLKPKNLSNSLDTLQVIEDELRERIERLETRQATDDASLLILNRYWNQVNISTSGSKINYTVSEML